jgi:polar amino acid transport system substrate-binding protein
MMPGWLRGLVTSLVVVLVGSLSPGVRAGQARTAKDGVYSDAQASRGEGLYGQQCAACHSADLKGNGAPALAGPEFFDSWNKAPVADLVEKISTSMPSSSPGSLSRDQATDLVAFILKANKFPAGSGDLASDVATLKTIAIIK